MFGIIALLVIVKITPLTNLKVVIMNIFLKVPLPLLGPLFCDDA